MHFQYQDMTLWYGTPDTPTPGESVQSGTENTITVGVQPNDASHKIEVLYKVNQGLTETLVAKWLRNHAASKSQYFKARFPAFHAGDVVEYTVICYCAGRQVPSPEEAEHFASSFRVMEHETESAASVAGNESLLVKPVTTVAVASLSSEVPPPPDSKVAMPLLSPKLETRINVIKTALADEEHQQAVDLALRAANGDMPSAMKNLTEKLPAASLQKIALAHSLADWSEDHISVVKALANQPELKNLRDVALHFNVEKLATLVDPKSVPESTAGATDDEKKRNFAVTLNDKLFAAEPTAVQQRMVQEAAIPIANQISAMTDGQQTKDKDYDQRNDRIAALLQNTVMGGSQQTKEKGSITLQHTVKYQGDISQFPFSNVRLTALFPMFDYVRSNAADVDVIRRIVSSGHDEIEHELSSDTYCISIPTSDLIGKKEETISNFSGFTIKALTTKNINALSFTIPVQVAADSAVFSISTFKAFYIIKNIARLFPRQLLAVVAPYDPSEAVSFLEKNIYLINKETYDKIFPEFRNITNRNDDWLLLSVISKFIDEADLDPTVPMELNDTSRVLLDRVLQTEDIEHRDEIIQFIGKFFNDLFDFPILIPAIKTLEVAGTFEVKTPDNALITKDDLLFYDLSFEYLSRSANDLVTSKIVRYDWNGNNSPVNGNKIPFSFSGTGKIILSNISGTITIRVKAFDGTILWSKDYEPNDPTLKEVPIVVSQLRPVTLKPAGTIGTTNTSKRLRGQVLELTKKCSLKDLTVVIQAKKEGDELWRVVAAATTDASGNFSIPYPYGVYKQAQAIVSLTPDSPVDVPIKDLGNENETIADDFLYLLITNPECPDLKKDKDCDCDAPKKAGRLPDHADLINSDEYAQDIGGSCVNLSTPNRTLNEFSYTAIVRTSDPDVANYTLIKNPDGSFVLKGDQKKIQRAAVDINNPIHWQDAPDSRENLSLYQALTVATGHVLHYKAEFKADGYSLGDLLYSLALAPGQKKQIVVIDSAHTLQAAESQNIAQGESLASSLLNERDITDQLGGNINEAMRGSSSANTSGVSAGFGLAGSYGPISGTLGVAGGSSSTDASASQNSSRDTSMFFGEKLRQYITQNAQSYRQLNATVVTAVKEGQQYAVTTDVVANHNHCHAMTMMYFEVLRHFAIYQEMVNVEECIFVPLLMTNFSIENIYKWADVLAQNLLPLPANTYLQPFPFLRYKYQHPLTPAFDAVQRVKTKYKFVDFPEGAYCDEPITSVTGYITIRVNIPRPKTVYDRVMSFPIVTRSSMVDHHSGIFGGLMDLVAGESIDVSKWEEREKFTNDHIVIYDNFQQARPADVIEVIKFDDRFFGDGSNDDNLWRAIAKLCGYGNDVFGFLTNFFSHKTISQWDTTFNDEIAPVVFESLIKNSIFIPPLSLIDFTTTEKYHGGERVMRLNFRTNTFMPRKDIKDIRVNYSKPVSYSSEFWMFATLTMENLNINYTTKHYEGYIINQYLGDDLYDNDGSKNPPIPTPMNTDEQRKPRTEDCYLVLRLIEHLNSNLEHYNKTLWYNLDPDRRYMLLDGFNIEIYDDFGVSVNKPRSLASVVKNELLTITGNSLVFPVAAGYKVSRSYIAEKNQQGEAENVSLFDHYKPYTPIPPYRISVPSRGVFLEAVQGQCDACEKVKENSSQDWTKFTTDEPTTVMPITTPVPTITDWKAAFKDFATPLINIQNAPAAPAPGAGLTGLTELLGKSGVFKDITGLDATQQNVIRTYLSNQENAKAFAEMAKNMQMQEHNTQHSDKIMDTLKTAKDSGAINQDEYKKLVKDHLQKQIDGGEAQNQQAAQENKKKETSPIKSAVDLAQTGNRDVSATETDSQGNTKTLDVKSKGDSTSKGDVSLKYDFTVPGTIEAIKQQSANACWATVTTMMSNWKKQRNQSVDDYIKGIGAEYVPFIQTGITIAKLNDFCNAAGLKTEYTNTEFPVSYYYEILQKNGPIWVIDLENADPKLLHGRLLIGIKGDDSSPKTMFTIIDPASGKQCNEDLPTFVSKTENVVKTLDAIKDVQIPLLIYYKDSYDKSKLSDTSKSDATIGQGAAATTATATAAAAPPPLAGIPVGVRRTMVFEIAKKSSALIDDSYKPFTGGFHVSTPKPPALVSQTVVFGAGVPEDPQVREGLRRVVFAFTGVDGGLKPLTSITLNIGDVRDINGATLHGGIFRFSRYKVGKQESILIEGLGVDGSPPEPLFRENFVNRYSREGYTLIGPGWTTKAMREIALLDEALKGIGTRALRLVPTATKLKFEYTARPADMTRGEDGHWNGVDTISLYYDEDGGPFDANAYRAGRHSYPIFVIHHEFGHAVRDFDPSAIAAFQTAIAADGGALTVYGKTNANESFAEAFACFTLDPGLLQALRPTIFAFFTGRYPK